MNSVCSVNWQLALEYLKVLSNWQLLAFVGCMVGGWVFKPQIGKLIDRIATIEMFGGKIDTATTQAQANSANQSVEPALPEAIVKTEPQPGIAEISKGADGKSPSVSDEAASPAPLGGESEDADNKIVVQLTQAGVDEFNAKLITERMFTTLWEYRYMNHYFAVSTQAVLNWLVQIDKQITKEQYGSVWLHRINKPEERGAILQALENHGCIKVEDGYLSVTPKGKEYWSFQERRIIHTEAYYPHMADIRSFDYATIMSQIGAQRAAT